MVFDLTPQPSEEERAAVEAALAQEEGEDDRASPWADRLLPQRDGEDEA
jgi:hypothetical protein